MKDCRVNVHVEHSSKQLYAQIYLDILLKKTWLY